MSNVIVFMSDEHNPLYSSPYGLGGGLRPGGRES